MRAIRSINNNIAVCVDSAGNELIAMGKGIGFGKLPREVSLDDITHTYYNVDVRGLAGLNGVSMDVLAFAAGVADRARDELSYRLSPNLAFTLADHIAFAIKRAKENLQVSMPLAYDVEQGYPAEYRIARQTVRRLRRDFQVALRDDEAAAIALNIVNSRLNAADQSERVRSQRDEDMLEDITEIIETMYSATIDRSAFAYSRYATHLNYLFKRLHAGESLHDGSASMYTDVRGDYPEAAACVEKIAEHVHDEWGCEITDEEKLYLFIHVNRLCAKGKTE